MGLRETNAARTREQILDVATRLFFEHGYDETKLEEIAAHADVSFSTLYRYFPTKVSLVLESVALRGQMAEEIRSRPAGEPLDVALGHAVLALLQSPRGDSERIYRISAVIGRSATLQGQVREDLAKEGQLLEVAICERLDRPRGDVYAAMSARIAVATFSLAGGIAGRKESESITVADIAHAAEEVMESLRHEPPAVPRVVHP